MDGWMDGDCSEAKRVRDGLHRLKLPTGSALPDECSLKDRSKRLQAWFGFLC